MAMESAVIEYEAMNLPPIERALLADRLLQTLDTSDESIIKAWGRVAEKRLEKYRSGEMEAFDADMVVAALRKTLR